MQYKLINLLHDWRAYMVTWTRDRLPKLLVILVLAFIFVRVLDVIAKKVVSFTAKRSSDGAARAQQVRTVAGVIRSSGVFLILFITGMATLKDAFNINIEPLLASAGIAGLAIGFGAQALVKDVITGFFILVENQYQVGDIIRAAGVAGMVEEITMRRTTLRDRDGTLHIIPNGNITIVSNMTRDWSQVALQVAVDYTENSDRVQQILRDVAKSFFEDPHFKQDVVAEPEVPGIEKIDGHQVEYLMLVKVRPGRQYDTARELRQRIKTAFEENKIQAGLPTSVLLSEARTAVK